ncbi:hypothetical protein ACOME3_007516 [Neoechinorhynchus agilis]
MRPIITILMLADLLFEVDSKPLEIKAGVDLEHPSTLPDFTVSTMVTDVSDLIVSKRLQAGESYDQHSLSFSEDIRPTIKCLRAISITAAAITIVGIVISALIGIILAFYPKVQAYNMKINEFDAEKIPETITIDVSPAENDFSIRESDFQLI